MILLLKVLQHWLELSTALEFSTGMKRVYIGRVLTAPASTTLFIQFYPVSKASSNEARLSQGSSFPLYPGSKQVPNKEVRLG